MRGAWVAQLVKRPASAQVMISGLVSLSPASGSVVTAQSLEPASDSVSPPLSDPLMLMLCLCLLKINKYLKLLNKKIKNKIQDKSDTQNNINFKIIILTKRYKKYTLYIYIYMKLAILTD